MITLMRDGIIMEVATELQASVFERSGYVRIEKPVSKAVSVSVEASNVDIISGSVTEEKPAEISEPIAETQTEEKPKRRRRTKKAE